MSNRSIQEVLSMDKQEVLSIGFHAYLSSESGKDDKSEILGNIWDFHNAANETEKIAAKDALNVTLARIIALVSAAINVTIYEKGAK